MDKEPAVVEAADRREPKLPLVAASGVAGNTLGTYQRPTLWFPFALFSVVMQVCTLLHIILFAEPDSGIVFVTFLDLAYFSQSVIRCFYHLSLKRKQP